ncbi:hypothetical protein V8G54_021709 [Vigna mungo]|uniref:RING-type domain-containing protein n=1 Tax=Vigna mungo TaxID=3915 RepID=A0AAQ3NHV8_VIGMU
MQSRDLSPLANSELLWLEEHAKGSQTCSSSPKNGGSSTINAPCSRKMRNEQVYADGIPSISSNERKATIKEFYAVIYPSLRLLQGEFNNDRRHSYAEVNRKRLEKVLSKDLEGDEECGICMENNMKMVLPNCGHSFCISCFHDW